MSAATPPSTEDFQAVRNRFIVAETPPGGGDDDDDRPKRADIPRSFEDF